MRGRNAGTAARKRGSSRPVEALLGEEIGALWGVRGYALDRHVKKIFVSWMIVFGLVCAQMAWVLKPFLGKPGETFQWFGARESNFLQAFWEALRALLP